MLKNRTIVAEALPIDCSGMNELADRYLDGNGIEQNYAEAMKWFKKSAELNTKTSPPMSCRRYGRASCI